MSKLNNRLLIKGIVSILAILKSFFLAITQVAWGLVSLIGLNLLLVYILTSYKQEIPSLIDKSFLILETFILNHVMLFVIVFFILYLYSELKEVWKK